MTKLLLLLLFFPISVAGVASEGYPEDPYIMATTYSWQSGGINCNEDCGSSAILPELKSDYLGHVAACPLDWVGYVNTTVIALWDGSEWWCLDTMAKKYQEWYWHSYTNQWVRVVDFSYRQPNEFLYNQWLIDDYTLQWRPVSEFFTLFEKE
jgi:hypothetical protein